MHVPIIWTSHQDRPRRVIASPPQRARKMFKVWTTCCQPMNRLRTETGTPIDHMRCALAAPLTALASALVRLWRSLTGWHSLFTMASHSTCRELPGFRKRRPTTTLAYTCTRHMSTASSVTRRASPRTASSSMLHEPSQRYCAGRQKTPHAVLLHYPHYHGRTTTMFLFEHASPFCVVPMAGMKPVGLCRSAMV